VIPTEILLMIKLMYIFGLASLTTFAETMDRLCALLFPMHCLCSSFKQIFVNYHSLKLCPRQLCMGVYSQCCNDYCERYICIPTRHNYLSFKEPGIGFYVVCMTAQGAFFFGIALLMDYHVLDHIWTSLPCVENSQEKHLEDGRDRLTLVNLYKCHGTLIAVDHLCLGLAKGECFIVLGQNGAGKSAIMQMLAGKVLVTSGHAYVMGHSVVKDIANVQGQIGYCPQTNGLLLHMTGRQTLTMYARLRGLPEDLISERIDSILDLLLLENIADLPAKTYSGGNRRKLTAAISLVDEPPVLLLDEPSTGMDPGARRQLLGALDTRRRRGATLLLTSRK
ncbi:ATP-binding cassette sub-family A member 3, partial [Elysia marginata]